MAELQIWHHGLVARSWAEFPYDGGQDVTYFQAMIERSGQPALDLGCGTGRLLLPYLHAGLDVDGCDYSKDMLEHCRLLAMRQGLAPQLYQQAIHALDLPRRYHTIIACGVVGLGGQRHLTMQAFRRCYEHLRSGGTFVFDYSPRWNDPPAWRSRLPDERRALPQAWPESSERERFADGSELELATRTVAMDPLEDVATRQIRARLWQDGVLVQEEIHTQQVEDYSKHELILMLERAGFAEISITGDYSDALATADHSTLLFHATKL
jgi:SAM-dependent methyltransferase